MKLVVEIEERKKKERGGREKIKKERKLIEKTHPGEFQKLVSPIEEQN